MGRIVSENRPRNCAVLLSSFKHTTAVVAGDESTQQGQMTRDVTHIRYLGIYYISVKRMPNLFPIQAIDYISTEGEFGCIMRHTLFRASD